MLRDQELSEPARLIVAYVVLTGQRRWTTSGLRVDLGVSPQFVGNTLAPLVLRGVVKKRRVLTPGSSETEYLFSDI